MHPDTQIFIDGKWQAGSAGRTLPVIDPADGSQIGTVAVAEAADVDRAVAAADRAQPTWQALGPYKRAEIIHKAVDLIVASADRLGMLITAEQGKPLAEGIGEVHGSARVIRWLADEGTRAYGRIIPSRVPNSRQMVLKFPVGPVAAFTPWNYPIAQAARKLGAGLAAGCTIVLKAAEETPASTAAFVQMFREAGVPAGVLNLLYGDSASISERLIADRRIRKVSFTGSTAIGRLLAGMAGAQLKRMTMELGGHAPAIVHRDADVTAAATMLAAHKYYNAGQVCIAPSRILVDQHVSEEFTSIFTEETRKLVVGRGVDAATTMGPLAHERRVQAAERLVQDATENGGRLLLGGERIGNQGYFFQPTILADVPVEAAIMNEEPFSPIAIINTYDTMDRAISEANRLDYGLAAYAFSRSNELLSRFANEITSGMVSINHYGLANPEVPFNGIRDSGFGSEGGPEAIEAYLDTKFVSQLAVA